MCWQAEYSTDYRLTPLSHLFRRRKGPPMSSSLPSEGQPPVANRIEVTLETEAQNPKCFLNDAVITLERETGNLWTGSVQQRSQTGPASLRLELGESTGASWDLGVKWGGEVVYSSHGNIMAPGERITAEIRQRGTSETTATKQPPPRRLLNETPYRVFIAPRERKTPDAIAVQIPPWGQRVVTVDERDALDL